MFSTTVSSIVFDYDYYRNRGFPSYESVTMFSMESYPRIELVKSGKSTSSLSSYLSYSSSGAVLVYPGPATLTQGNLYHASVTVPFSGVAGSWGVSGTGTGVGTGSGVPTLSMHSSSFISPPVPGVSFSFTEERSECHSTMKSEREGNSVVNNGDLEYFQIGYNVDRKNFVISYFEEDDRKGNE